MSSTSQVGGPRSMPRGIVAPGPRVQIGIKQGDRFEIRPGEPLHVFLEQAVGGRQDIAMSSANGSAFVVARSQAPVDARRPLPASPGVWFTISLVRGVEPGRSEEAKLLARVVVPGAAPITVATFTLVSGSQRYY